ncbi:low affinity iron permease family protein [Flavobacterium sp.]|jgi:low affinity Fe/Cu permease|uniref:low affinity iron permease family protein n=1 Tax=Flavobacterium sp. TaxID=239 RepID=UPI0038FCFDAF
MKSAYFNIEKYFELLVSIVTKILGNSITFIFAFILVIFWWITNLPTSKDLHQNIGDIIFGITFLSLFIIQKSFNRYSALIHLKMNELISSHEPANNSVMDMGKKTEKEIVELYKEYIETETDDLAEKVLDNALKDINIENQI